ncbi:unnamed protein product [Sphagnum jensenii]|jgi:hypothetical protein
MAMQNEKRIPAPVGYQPFSSDQSSRAHVHDRKATGSRKEFIAQKEGVTRKSENPAKRLQRDLRWTFLLIISKIVS